MSNLPLFWPGALISALAALLLCRPVGRALGIRAGLAAAAVASLGVILAATLTPLRSALEAGAAGTGRCDFSRFTPLPLSELAHLGDPTMNVLLFIPLGIAIGLIGGGAGRGLLLAAIALPFAIETIQLLAPVLARGCESADVVDNLTGLLVGLVLGRSAAWVADRRASATGSG